MNLNEILSNVDRIAEEGVEIPLELHEDLKNKVDSYYKVLSILGSEAERLKFEANHLQQKQKSVENNIANLRKYILNNMKHFGWLKIKGQNHSATLVNTKKWKVYADPRNHVGEPFVKEVISYEFDQELMKELVITDAAMKDICGFESAEQVRIM